MSYTPLYDALKDISHCLRYQDMTSLGSDTLEKNESNDTIKEIDVIANDKIKAALVNIPEVIAYISEEERELKFLPKKEHCKKGTIVIFDPLDGSKNVKSNITVGTIYGIYTYNAETDTIEEVLETGYCLYSFSTLLVRSVAQTKVQMFTLGADNNFSLLRDVSKTTSNSIYCINMSYNYCKDVDYFLKVLKKEKCTQRWCGAMVADAHQVLITGGTFVYPHTDNKPKGKIRFLYEALPFSYLFSLLGGTAVDLNLNGILARLPRVKLSSENIHRETPVILSTYYNISQLKDIFEINDIINC
jgi:fructose-1,6-bisphosphatase I